MKVSSHDIADHLKAYPAVYYRVMRLGRIYLFWATKERVAHTTPRGDAMTTASEVVHLAPESGSANTRCCALPPFELPRGDRITNDPDLATCWTGSDPRLNPVEGDRA